MARVPVKSYVRVARTGQRVFVKPHVRGVAKSIVSGSGAPRLPTSRPLGSVAPRMQPRFITNFDRFSPPRPRSHAPRSPRYA